MKTNLATGLFAVFLLLSGEQVLADEVPIHVAKNQDREYIQDTAKNVSALENLITESGSVVVWVTLDPESVNFSPGLTTKLSDEERIAQDKRVRKALKRILSPLISAKTVSRLKRSETQFGHAGLVRVNHTSALRAILADSSVVMVTRAAL